MRRLLLIRHAKAEPSMGRDDYERALTDRGRGDARRVAEFLETKGLVPDVLVHSGALRARQTAETFSSTWRRRIGLAEEPGLYDATEGMLLARVRGLDNGRPNVGLVGHNPGLGELAVALAGSGAFPDLRRMAAKFPTCAVAVLEFPVESWNDVERGGALLALFATPAELDAGTG